MKHSELDDPDPEASGLTVPPEYGDQPLRACVAVAVQRYFKDLDGAAVCIQGTVEVLRFYKVKIYRRNGAEERT